MNCNGGTEGRAINRRQQWTLLIARNLEVSRALFTHTHKSSRKTSPNQYQAILKFRKNLTVLRIIFFLERQVIVKDKII